MGIYRFLHRINEFLWLKKKGANLFSTIWFNFKMLPLDEAIHFPFILYGIVRFDECTPYRSGGGVRRHSGSKLLFKSWAIGRKTYHLANSNSITRIVVKGELFVGDRGTIYNGASIIVHPDAVLTIGTGSVISTYSRIICYRKITIGNHVNISWECQIYDTNFHFVVNESGEIKRKDGEVIIGHNVWIANRVTIAKGAKIPNDSIVASNSLVNKDYSCGESGIFAGMPAILVKPKCRGEFYMHKEINKYFKEHSDDVVYISRFLEDIGDCSRQKL